MMRVLAIAALLLGAVPSAALATEGGGGLISLDKSLVIQAINFYSRCSTRRSWPR
jgi:hypothetical protein